MLGQDYFLNVRSVRILLRSVQLPNVAYVVRTDSKRLTYQRRLWVFLLQITYTKVCCSKQQTLRHIQRSSIYGPDCHEFLLWPRIFNWQDDVIDYSHYDQPTFARKNG